MNRPGAAARHRLPVMLVVALFFLWGVANTLNDVLIAHFKKLFTLSDLGAGLVQSAFYLGYFWLAIPAALFMRAQGYRAAVLLGLLLFGLGALLFWPAARAQSYPFFLLALFVIASGLAFLETSANPLIAGLGAPATASRRLNLAQAFNPLGSITGVMVGSHFILSGVTVTLAETATMSPAALTDWREQAAAAVQMPYLSIAACVIALALLIRLTPFPAVATERGAAAGPATLGDVRVLLRTPRLTSGVVAQFCYVGAQVGIWSFLIRYVQIAMPGTDERRAASCLTVSLLLFMIGRFAGTALMTRVAALPLLAVAAASAGVLCLVAATVGGGIGIAALVASSLFMSIMYPTIFAEAVGGLGVRTKSASALLVMAIIGGAVFPVLMGLVSDVSGSILIAMLVPAGCFAVVHRFARQARGLPA